MRQRGDRCIYLAGDNEPIVTSDIATAIELRAVAKPLVSKKNRLVPISVRFGWCTVPLKPGGKAYTLIKAEHRPESNPMMLLTTERPRTARQCAKLVTAYYRRWGVEDQIRADKQLCDLESVRVLNYESLQNLLAFTVIASGILALQEAAAPRRATFLARQAPITGRVPPYRAYRIRLSVQTMLGRIPLRI